MKSLGIRIGKFRIVVSRVKIPEQGKEKPDQKEKCQNIVLFEDPDGDFSILMDKIIERIPAPKGDPAAEPLLQIASLEYSTFLGRLAVGRVQQGTIKPNQTYAQAFTDGTVKTIRPQKILRYEGPTNASDIGRDGPYAIGSFGSSVYAINEYHLPM